MPNPSQEARDELARRRALRSRAADPGPAADAGGEEDLPRFGWSDVLAMTIAAYQIIMPIVLLFIGVVVLVYLLFRFIFL